MKKLLCSACLLGVPCRYDGKSKPIKDIALLKEKYDLIPVCPETAGQLATPRLPCEIRDNEVIRKDGVNMTKAYKLGAQKTLNLAKENNVTIALFKEKSPSCGVHFRYDGTFQGKLLEKPGITTSLLKENGLEVFSENEIKNLMKIIYNQ